MADSDIVRLTQGQIKMIGDKIKEAGGGGGGITELTSADYNYPTNNPTGVALWLLPSGIYKTKEGENLTVFVAQYQDLLTRNRGMVFIITTKSSNSDTSADRIIISNGDNYARINTVTPAGILQYNASSLNYSNTLSARGQIVTADRVINNLTTATEHTGVLDAYLGKVLNDKIGGDLSTLTTTDKTSLIAAINELNTRLSALEGN